MVVSGRSGRLRSAKASGWSDGPGGAPDRVAHDVEPDRAFGELGADRLVLDDAAAALDAKLRILQRGLVGGAADAEIERLGERDGAAGVGGAADARADFPPAPGTSFSESCPQEP